MEFLLTAAINCTGQTNVRFSCKEYFRQYVASTGVISVSNDGTTWTEVYHAETGLLTGEGSANPRDVDFDISAIADNQATVYIRFEFIGDWDFFWFIDDIAVYSPDQNDAGVAGVNLDFNYCSLGATAPISVVLKNLGIDPITTMDVSYQVNSGTPVTETWTGNLASFDTVVYTFTQTADMSAPGIYTVTGFHRISW